jgi:AraC-like DNA-binding protein
MITADVRCATERAATSQELHRSPSAFRKLAQVTVKSTEAPTSVRRSVLLVHKRFWSEHEMRPQSPLVASLHREPSLFRFRAAATEASAHGGPLSLKTTFAGQTAYRFGNRELLANPSRVLVVPPHTRYTTQVSAAGTDIATFYFPAACVADALNTLTLKDEQLLEARSVNPDQGMDFAPHGREICPRMRGILAALNQSEPPLDDLGMLALEMTVQFSLEARRAMARLPASRPSVRRELFRRACAARDEIIARPESTLELHALAKTSSLSPFHLHRVFRAAFGETPALMQRRIRAERAQRLLAETNHCIAEIGRLIGFENDSAFSRSFRTVTGISPRCYRRTHAPHIR